MLKAVFVTAILFCVAFSSSAEARHKHHHKRHQQTVSLHKAKKTQVAATQTECGDISGWWKPIQEQKNVRESIPISTAAKRHHERVAAKVVSQRYHIENAQSIEARIIEHPPGCPWRAFCGCGAAVEVFGRPIRALWLAANWYRFPRTEPHAGAVAVRRHHVFVLRQHIQGDIWLAYDANSGKHATRIHPRSIAGYTIVNPHGYRV